MDGLQSHPNFEFCHMLNFEVPSGEFLLRVHSPRWLLGEKRTLGFSTARCDLRDSNVRF
jgi:hypothetical protein